MGVDIAAKKSQYPAQAQDEWRTETEMIDAIVERAFPWGVFIALGALVGAAFPQETRRAAKTVMLTGFRAADWVQEMGAEAFEKGSDVFAETRLEYEQMARQAQREAERSRLRVVDPTPRRRRTRRAAETT